MIIRFLSLIFFLLVIYSSQPLSKEDSGKSTTYLSMVSKEKKAVRLYKKGNFKKAYKLFREMGYKWGLKDSQYYLAFMYLKGQFVDQDIVMGMGLLGVAIEAPIKERVELFEEIYNKLTDSQRTEINEKIKELRGQIGIDVKNIKCVETQEVGSRRPIIRCDYYHNYVNGSNEDEIN